MKITFPNRFGWFQRCLFHRCEKRCWPKLFYKNWLKPLQKARWAWCARGTETLRWWESWCLSLGDRSCWQISGGFKHFLVFAHTWGWWSNLFDEHFSQKDGLKPPYLTSVFSWCHIWNHPIDSLGSLEGCLGENSPSIFWFAPLEVEFTCWIFTTCFHSYLTRRSHTIWLLFFKDGLKPPISPHLYIFFTDEELITFKPVFGI